MSTATKRTKIRENTSLESLNLSTRALTPLERNNIRTVGDLVQFSEKEVLWMEGIGDDALQDIKDLLAEAGYALLLHKPRPRVLERLK